MQFNEQQQKVIDVVSRSTGDVTVTARAGTGKTTTIVEAGKKSQAKALYTCFNKSIANELTARIGKDAKASTFNGLGHSIIVRQLPGSRFSEFATRDRCKKALGRSASIKDVTSLANLVAMSKARLAASAEDVSRVARTYELDGCPSKAWEVMEKQLESPAGEFDYSDQVWLPVSLKLAHHTHDVVFVDEAQDLTPAQIQLASMCAPRKVYVGDDRQAIYNWRGASVDTMSVLQSFSEHCLTMPVTYRCGRLIVQHCKQWVSDFTCGTRRHGDVIRGNALSASPGDFILSRTNAPLVKLALQFIRARRPAFIRGRNVVASKLKKIVKDHDTSRPFMSWLTDYKTKMVEQLLKEEKPRQADQFADCCECLKVLHAVEPDKRNMLKLVDKLFTRDMENAIVLSSVHRAKGLETKNVYVLKNTFRWEGLEEDNLRYVAASRAENKLIYDALNV